MLPSVKYIRYNISQVRTVLLYKTFSIENSIKLYWSNNFHEGRYSRVRFSHFDLIRMKLMYRISDTANAFLRCNIE